jgi:hypothetical protein
LTYPSEKSSEKYESQWEGLFPIYGKIKAMFQITNQPILYMVNLCSSWLIWAIPMACR